MFIHSSANWSNIFWDLFAVYAHGYMKSRCNTAPYEVNILLPNMENPGWSPKMSARLPLGPNKKETAVQYLMITYKPTLS